MAAGAGFEAKGLVTGAVCVKEKVEPPLPKEGGGLDEVCGAKVKLKPDAGGDVTPFGGDVSEG